MTKTVADKLLKEMEQNGQIMGKATKKDGGGQWVFWALQVCVPPSNSYPLDCTDVHYVPRTQQTHSPPNNSPQWTKPSRP